jgi:hypothetical protein
MPLASGAKDVDRAREGEQVARKALEPPEDPTALEQASEIIGLARKGSPEALQNGSGTRYPSGLPRNWGSVYVACLDAVLQAAIVSHQHADVWEAAAALLRCPVQYRPLPSLPALAPRWPCACWAPLCSKC